MKKIVKYTVLAIISLPLLLLIAWNVSVSEEFLKETIEKKSVHAPYSLKLNGFNKSIFIPFKVNIAEIKLLQDKTVMAVISDAVISIKLEKILSGNLFFTFSGRVSSGAVNLTYTAPLLKPFEKTLTAAIDSVELSGLGFIKKAGIKGSGLMSGNFTLNADNKGDGVFEVKKCHFEDFHGGGLYLPAKYITEITGKLSTDTETVNIESVYLTAENISCRISGKIINGSLDVSIQIMPDADFKDKTILLLLKQYEVSPGVYVVRIARKLSFLNFPF
ncbi:hypothetical protein [Candidatus Magnetomonas plexicatena]|uniref:hypothetical protein n=1 Tax=Candidatus Magnetomonas plexicatena TaxID=2552947 RepID=UPI001C74649A|nr:hypothetical protein E2O03_008125 [Nitrospirales bacterium LBB_01]